VAGYFIPIMLKKGMIYMEAEIGKIKAILDDIIEELYRSREIKNEPVNWGRLVICEIGKMIRYFPSYGECLYVDILGVSPEAGKFKVKVANEFLKRYGEPIEIIMEW